MVIHIPGIIRASKYDIEHGTIITFLVDEKNVHHAFIEMDFELVKRKMIDLLTENGISYL